MSTGQRCAECDRAVALRATGPRGKVCSACAARARRVGCSRCGRFQPPTRRDPEGRPICRTCIRQAASEAATAAMRADIVAVVELVEPDLDTEVIAAAVVAAAPNLRHTESLAAAVAGGPEALVASSVAPPVMDRLVAELRSVGAANVSPPRCYRCGTTRWVEGRVDGLRACTGCAAKARAELCGRCGRHGPVSTRDAGGAAVCFGCRNTDPTHFEVCVRCARRRRVTYRAADGGALCGNCGRPRPVVACASCGKTRVATSSGKRGPPRCGTCAKRRATCSGCGLDAIVVAAWPRGPVCSTCHKKALSAKGTCTACGERRRIDPRDPDQAGRCSECAGLEPWSVCGDCGVEERIYEAGRCIACTVVHRLRELVGDSAIHEPLRASLVDTDGPRAALRWLSKPETGEVLGAMARGEVAASHEGLDKLVQTNSLAHLRRVLISAGVLADRDEATARLERWIHEHLDAMAVAEDRRIIEAFASWWVLRRHRGRMSRTGVSSDKHSRRQVLAAIAFMDWLDGHDLTLGTCTQAHVELWLAGPPGRRRARDFLRWACRHRLAHDLDIGRRPDPVPARSVDAADQARLARRFLDDDALPLVDRVAGLLVMHYGQPLARIVRLRTHDVTTTPTATTIAFGSTPTELSDAEARLVLRLVADRRGRATTGAGTASPWLFVGARPGRALGAARLGVRLGTYGIDARATRNALMLDLGAELGPGTLADLLGIHTSTAVRWVRAGGGDWSSYVGARARN
jgi:hypothetical protein